MSTERVGVNLLDRDFDYIWLSISIQIQIKPKNLTDCSLSGHLKNHENSSKIFQVIST